MKPLIILALVLAASAAEARDRNETCESYQRATGTVVTDCRRQGEKPRHCESYTSITGTTTTTCR
jgi:hypothetical protein